MTNNTPPSPTTRAAATEPTMIRWVEKGVANAAHWRSERGSPPAHTVTLADDSTNADAAYRLACEGTAMLWRGDFHQARQLLQALARRIDHTPQRKRRKLAGAPDAPLSAADQFHRHRMAQSQRARILGMLLVQMEPDYRINLRRAPDVLLACSQAWGPPVPGAAASVVALRELMGVTSAHGWRTQGVEVAALGAAPNNRIYPHYGVFSPLRGEYVDLVAQEPLPVTGQTPYVAFDIGTGSGVLAAVLARRDLHHIVATDTEPRALACARDNLQRLGLQADVAVLQTDVFPEGRASLVVCNPPWLPVRPGTPIERAVYDERGRMLKDLLGGLRAHLAPGGEAWLILSDLAEHLGLRSRAQLLDAIAQAGLQVAGRSDTQPQHPKAMDRSDALHYARTAEVTSLWRLRAAPNTTGADQVGNPVGTGADGGGTC